MRLSYIEWAPEAATVAIVDQANAIAAEYLAQGYDLTLRQLYYQFVARAIIPNNQQSYKRLGNIVNQGRLAGMIDWSYLVDRTRDLVRPSHWSNPGGIIQASAESYDTDHWTSDLQDTRVEVWVEKEALAGVVARAAEALDCSYFACRGYVSQSEMWEAGQRFLRYWHKGQKVVVLHLGDHDPSGIDMTRDIETRLRMFGRDAVDLTVRRIALNMDQVEEYQPPPNPAKTTDSRSEAYIEEYGNESWELDALDPATLDALIREHIEQFVDRDAFDGTAAEVQRDRDLLTLAADNWDEVVGYLEENWR